MSNAKKVLVFFSFRKHKTGYYNTLFNPLKAVEADYGLELFQGSMKDLIIEIIDNKLVVTEYMTGQPLESFDFVRFELWLKAPQQALAAATYLSRHTIPFSGREALNTLCTTKVGELVRMSDNDLALPRTYMSSHHVILEKFKKNPPIAYPFIAKAADSFGGKMNYLVHTYAELKAALQENKDQFFVLQEFIPNEFDYRVLVMDNEIQFVLKRSRLKSSDSHLNNTSAGAEGEFVPIDTLTDAQKADALKAAALTLRSDFAGVDLLVNSETGEHVVLEVNEAPAIQTGADPERKIAALMAHIQKKVTEGARNV